MLCSVCQKIQHELSTSRRSGPGFHFADTNTNACPGCDILLQAERKAQYPRRSIVVQEARPAFIELIGGIRVLGVKGQSNPWGLIGTQDPANTWGLTPSSQKFSDNTFSPVALEELSEWIRQCDETHHECQVDCEARLPHRYIDLGEEHDDTWKLRESQGDTGRYLCLSYSWGGQDFCKTTKENISDHKNGIPSNELPRLFQDVTKIARMLRIRFIWIDALCIIQDSPEDWQKESACMLEVYRNAYITVASVSTTSPHDSCFFPMENLRVGSHSVLITTHFPSSREFTKPPKDFPMLSRAWTYQERYISRRVVYFGSSELLWDCFQDRKCQCGGAQYSLDEVKKTALFRHVIQYERQGYNPELSAIPLTSIPPDLKWRQDCLWRCMVIQYSILQLSWSSDKLPALSGLAAVFQRATGKTYVAGLWEESLIPDLCWFRESIGNNTTGEGTSSRAPSWSWASTDDAIKYDLSLYCYPGSDHIQYCGTVRKVVCERTTDSNVLVHAGFIDLDASVLSVQFNESSRATDHKQVEYGVKMDGNVGLNGPEQKYIIPLCHMHRYVGLLVIRDGSCMESRFKRIGYAATDVGHRSEEYQEWLKLQTTTIRIV